MKRPMYMSPSSVSLFYKDQEEYYLCYLAESPPPRFPQTRPMSVGSSFDAYAKSYLHEALFGKGSDLKFEFKTIFEAQVEPHNRDWALVHGKYCFEQYQKYGALADLLSELQDAIGTPRFEIELRRTVENNVLGIPMLGRPDLFFIHKNGGHIEHDFKVNGYCGNGNTSPMKGYVRMRGPNTHTMHKDCFLMNVSGFQINGAMYLEQSNQDWAQQLAIYGWLCGEEVGAEFVVAIDQLVCSYNGEFPLIRTAEHRLRIGGVFQVELFKRVQHAWEVVNSDHYFRDMSKEESQKRCSVLDQYGNAFRGGEKESWLTDLVRGERRY